MLMKLGHGLAAVTRVIKAIITANFSPSNNDRYVVNDSGDGLTITTKE